MIKSLPGLWGAGGGGGCKIGCCGEVVSFSSMPTSLRKWSGEFCSSSNPKLLPTPLVEGPAASIASSPKKNKIINMLI